MFSNCSNASFLHDFPSSFRRLHTLVQKCVRTEHGTFSLAAYSFINVVVLIPLYIYILYLGLQRWCRQQCAAPISHTDAFTYHMIIIEQLSVFGSLLVWCGAYSADVKLVYIGLQLSLLNLSGENAFHLLTCIERYIAVTYPITYLNLRKKKGIRIRNVAIGCAWLMTLGCVGLLHVNSQHVGIIIYILVTGSILGSLCFCSLNVLYVLIRPQPVQRRGHRQHVDQSKLRAFYSATLILVVVAFRCVGFIPIPLVFMINDVSEDKSCILLITTFWLSFPSNLVLPLLYLQRAGKLPEFKCNNKSA